MFILNLNRRNEQKKKKNEKEKNFVRKMWSHSMVECRNKCDSYRKQMAKSQINENRQMLFIQF